MTVDVATLVFEFKSDSAGQAEKAMDRLITKGETLEGVARKVRTATDRINEGHQGAAGAAEKAAQGAMALATAEGAAERATRGSAKASAELRAQRALDAAAMRELVAADKAYEREAIRSAKARAAAQIAASRETERALDQQIASAIRGQTAFTGAMAGGARGAKHLQLAALDLSRQFADVGVTAAMGMNPLMILIQQGPQIADRLAMMKSEGVGLSAALRQLGVSLGLLRVSLPAAAAQAAEMAVTEQAVAAAALETAAADRAATASTVALARARVAQATSAAAAAAAELELSAAMTGQVAASQAAAAAAARLATANEAVAATAAQAAAAETVALAPIAAALAAAAAALAAAFGVAALAARDLNKDNKDLAASLGLTEKQLDHLKDKGVETSVTLGDVFRGTFNYIKDATKGLWQPLVDGFNWVLDKLTGGVVGFAKIMVGSFVGAVEAVKAVWKLLPAAIGDVVISTAQKVVDATTTMINAVIDRINALRPMINTALQVLNAPVRLPEINRVSGVQLSNPFAGAAQDAATVAADAFNKGFERGAAGVQKVLDGISKAILDAARARIKEAAGDPGKPKKGPADPRDMTDERTAQVAAMIEQAKRDELQATLAVTKDIHKRADIERQMLVADIAMKQAQIDRQIASIADDKGLSDATKKDLIFKLAGVQAQIAVTGLIQQRAINENEASEAAKLETKLKLDALAAQRSVLESQADLLKSSYARAVAELEILDLKQKEEELQQQAVINQLKLNGYSAEEIQIAEDQLAAMRQVHANERELAKRSTTLAEAMRAATGYVSDFKDAFRRHDFAGLMDALAATIQTIQASFQQNGMLGGLMTTAGAIGSLVGGKVGKALVTGATYAVGAGALASGLGAVGGQMILAGGTGALGTLGMGLAQFSAFLGAAAPIIGLVAGLVSLAKAFQKPSNKGAGYDLISGEISGQSRDEETTQAVTQAAQAIMQGQETLKALGLTLNETINGLVIGSRDPSQIYTSSGKTLFAAKGDPAAAVDAALKAVLEGASYVSDTQKKLVESMLAAGKGFDEIAAMLQQFAQAQAFAQAVSDELLKRTNPQQYDVTILTRQQHERDLVFQAMIQAGYFTADQIAQVGGQIEQLRALELNEVLKKYGAAVDDNTLSLEDATDQLTQAYDEQAAVLQDTISRYRALADSLGKFRQSLNTGPAAMLSPEAQYFATKAAFEQTAAKARLGDETALNDLQGVSQEYLDASKAYYASSGKYFDDLAAVKAAVEAAEAVASRTASNAEMQLSVMKSQMQLLGLIEEHTRTFAEALANFNTAKTAASAVTGSAGATASFNGESYLAANPDVAAAWQDYQTNQAYWVAGGYRPDETAQMFAEDHYRLAGQTEGRTGFATGGEFTVGGFGGPDSQNFGPIDLSPGEVVNIRRPGDASNDNAELIAEIKALRSEVAALTNTTRQGADHVAQTTRTGLSTLDRSVRDRGKTQRLAGK